MACTLSMVPRSEDEFFALLSAEARDLRRSETLRSNLGIDCFPAQNAQYLLGGSCPPDAHSNQAGDYQRLLFYGQTMRRRELLKSAGLLAGAVRMAAQPPTGRRTPLAYVASYSSPEGPEGSKGHGEGIYLFEMDLVSGVLSRREVFPNPDNPSWLAFDRSHTHLYSANETSTYQSANSGSVSAYSVEPFSGH